MNGIIPQRASIDNSDMTDGRAGYLFLPSLRTPFATELTRHPWLFSTTSGTTTVIATTTKGAAARNARSSLLSTCVHRIDHMYVCARAWTHEKPSRQKWQVGFPVRCLKRYQTGARTGMIGTNGSMPKEVGAMDYIWSQEEGAEEKDFGGNGQRGEPSLGSFLRRRQCPDRKLFSQAGAGESTPPQISSRPEKSD